MGRCGAAVPRVAVDHQRRVPRSGGAGPRHRCLGRDHRARYRHRPDRRRPAARPVLAGISVLVNVPIVVAGFAGALLLVPDSKNPAADSPDPWGAVLSVAGLPAAVGDHRGSCERLGLRDGSRSRAGQPGRPRHLCRWEARSRHSMLKISCCRRRRTASWDRSRRATPGWDQPPTPWHCRSAARSGSS